MSVQELEDKYKADLKELQEICKHEEISDWVEERWRPQSCTGREVKFCKNCLKTIEFKGKYHWEEVNTILTHN